MYTVEIILDTVNKVKRYIVEASSKKYDITVESQDGYIVDGKSILGILSLDLSKPIFVKLNCSHKEYDNWLDKYSVNR